MVLKIVKTVWPVMLTYVAIGAPCGMIMAQSGMEPWMVFALSSTFVTGSGQFMVCNLWLAGVPAASIVASVAAISSRFALYSASIAPYLTGASKRQTLAVAATLTEEAYGISLAKLIEGEDWGPRESFVLNAILIATWGVSCTMGAAVGAVVDVPTAIAGFVCTSLFICLLFSQRLSRGLVGGTFQVLFSVPGLCVGITLSILLLYIIYQEQLISTDPLTGLNNRNRFETYMLSLFSNVDQAEDVYLLMMDADGFKQINDRYGHVEGDHALQVISATLKEVCSASGGFIARYGGDEFVVLQKATAEQDIMCLCAAISDELARAEVPYLLRMSIGYARVGDGVDTWQDLLRAADAELYRVKREKKKAGVQIR